MSKKTISFEDFGKMDIRIGTIVSAEIVPETDKLLKLSVDVGEETPRQIISGIRAYFPDPHILRGTQTLFVVNLEPKTIQGYESAGMLFAAGGVSGCVLLTPQQPVTPGTPMI